MEGLVRTVVGDVAPEELGPTYGHEHLLTRPAGPPAAPLQGRVDLGHDGSPVSGKGRLGVDLG